MRVFEMKCKDDPEANDRQAKPGDVRYTLKFPLEDGSELHVHMGRESMKLFQTFIGNLIVDEAAEREMRGKNA